MTLLLRRTFLFSGKYYARLFGFGLLTVCIPIVLASFLAYSLLSRNLEVQVKQANLGTMLQIQARIDDEWNTVVKANRGIVFDTSILQYIYKRNTTDYIEMMDIQAKLTAMKRTIEHASNVSLLVPSQHSALSTLAGYEWIEDVAARFPFVHKEEPSSPMQWVGKSGSNNGHITFVQSMPAISESPQAFLIVEMEDNALNDVLKAESLPKNKRLMVLNDDGDVIAFGQNLSGSPSADYKLADVEKAIHSTEHSGSYTDTGSGTLIVYTKSAVNGWTTVLSYPLSELDSERTSVAKLTALICMGALAVGMLLLYVNSRKLYAPVRKLLGQDMRPNDTNISKIDEWAWISSSLDRLQLEADTLHEQSNRNALLLRDVFFMRLVYGHYVNEPLERLAELCGQHGVIAIGKWKTFAVEVESEGKYDKFQKNDRQLILLAISSICRDIANQHHIKAHFVNGLEAAQVIVILQATQEWTEETFSAVAYQIGESVRLAIDAYLKIPASIGIGNVYGHIQEVRLSYLEAIEALKYRIMKGGNQTIQMQDLKPDTKSSFRYPFDKGAAILQELASGNIDSTMEAYQEFVKAITSQYYTAAQVYEGFQMLYISLFNKVKEHSDECVSRLAETGTIEAIAACKTVEEIQTWFAEVIFPIVIPAMEEASNKRGKLLVERAKKHIASALDQDLSLQMVAEYVELSPSYFSRLFQKYTGQNFSNYAAEQRLELAKELLIHTDESIGVIAEKISYTERSFRRLFKNATGQSPTAYREVHRK